MASHVFIPKPDQVSKKITTKSLPNKFVKKSSTCVVKASKSDLSSRKSTDVKLRKTSETENAKNLIGLQRKAFDNKIKPISASKQSSTEVGKCKTETTSIKIQNKPFLKQNSCDKIQSISSPKQSSMGVPFLIKNKISIAKSSVLQKVVKDVKKDTATDGGIKKSDAKLKPKTTCVETKVTDKRKKLILAPLKTATLKTKLPDLKCAVKLNPKLPLSTETKEKLKTNQAPLKISQTSSLSATKSTTTNLSKTLNQSRMLNIPKLPAKPTSTQTSKSLNKNKLPIKPKLSPLTMQPEKRSLSNLSVKTEVSNSPLKLCNTNLNSEYSSTTQCEIISANVPENSLLVKTLKLSECDSENHEITITDNCGNMSGTTSIQFTVDAESFTSSSKVEQEINRLVKYKPEEDINLKEDIKSKEDINILERNIWTLNIPNNKSLLVDASYISPSCDSESSNKEFLKILHPNEDNLVQTESEIKNFCDLSYKQCNTDTFENELLKFENNEPLTSEKSNDTDGYVKIEFPTINKNTQACQYYYQLENKDFPENEIEFTSSQIGISDKDNNVVKYLQNVCCETEDNYTLDSLDDNVGPDEIKYTELKEISYTQKSIEEFVEDSKLYIHNQLDEDCDQQMDNSILDDQQTKTHLQKEDKVQEMLLKSEKKFLNQDEIKPTNIAEQIDIYTNNDISFQDKGLMNENVNKIFDKLTIQHCNFVTEEIKIDNNVVLCDKIQDDTVQIQGDDLYTDIEYVTDNEDSSNLFKDGQSTHYEDSLYYTELENDFSRCTISSNDSRKSHDQIIDKTMTHGNDVEQSGLANTLQPLQSNDFTNLGDQNGLNIQVSDQLNYVKINMVDNYYCSESIKSDNLSPTTSEGDFLIVNYPNVSKFGIKNEYTNASENSVAELENKSLTWTSISSNSSSSNEGLTYAQVVKKTPKNKVCDENQWYVCNLNESDGKSSPIISSDSEEIELTTSITQPVFQTILQSENPLVDKQKFMCEYKAENENEFMMICEKKPRKVDKIMNLSSIKGNYSNNKFKDTSLEIGDYFETQNKKKIKKRCRKEFLKKDIKEIEYVPMDENDVFVIPVWKSIWSESN